jgi:integrase
MRRFEYPQSLMESGSMNLLVESAEHPHPLALLEPLPLTRHPAAVYLSQLAESSRRTMGHNLNWCAKVLTSGQCDSLTLDWAKLRYEHTAALRSILMETHPPSTANLKLTAVKQSLKAARKLKLMDADDYEDAVSVDRIHGDAPLRGRLLKTEEIQALVKVCIESETAIGTRDAAAVACFCAGLRRAEVAGLDYGDCDLEIGGLFVREGKGKKYRQAYLIPGGLELLENWINLRGRRAGTLFYASGGAKSYRTGLRVRRSHCGCKSGGKLPGWNPFPPMILDARLSRTS